MDAEISCEHCGSTNIVLSDQFESYTFCQDCGLAHETIDNTSNRLSFSNAESVEFSSFCYRRANHFSEWLQNSQAKESMVIPEEVLEKVMGLLVKKGVQEEDITHSIVRSCLKELSLKKYYEHSILLCSMITGKRPPQFTPLEEQQLRIMFSCIQRPFEQVKESRANFLSYAYCLNKMSQLLGIRRMSKTYALLKGAQKLHKQDVIWHKICRILNWRFIPSI